jgi:hypothetical protein
MNERKYRVIAGPYRIARRYAESMGWAEDQYIIVTRGHQLACLDPALILSIITVKLHTMALRVMTEIHDEIERVKILWPVPTLAEA